MPSSLLTIGPLKASTETPRLTASGISNVIDNIPQDGLILWLDATKIAGITSGTSLSAWTDSSASASHATQPSAGSQPIYLTNGQNGNAVVSWSTGGRAMLSSNMSLLQNQTFAIVGVSRTTTGNQAFFGSPGGNVVMINNSVNYQIVTNATLSGSAFTSNAWISMIAQLSGSSTTFSVSGKTFFGNAGTLTAALCNLGAVTPASGWLNGAIGEVAVYNKILSESERTSLETYLRTKWGTL